MFNKSNSLKILVAASLLMSSIALNSSVEAVKIINNVYDEEGNPFPGIRSLGITIIHQRYNPPTPAFEYGWEHGVIPLGETAEHDISEFVQKYSQQGWKTNIYGGSDTTEPGQHFKQVLVSIDNLAADALVKIFARKLEDGFYKLEAEVVK